MWMTRVSIANPVFATMVMVALMVLGLFAYTRLSVEQLPDITPPIVTVSVNWPGAGPETIENEVSRPLEEAVNAIAGVKQIRSNAYEGRNVTIIEFRLDAEVNQAIQEVRDRVGQARAAFPRDVKEPFIAKVQTDNQQPVVTYALVSKTVALRELTTLARQVVSKQLEKAAGVGRVVLTGAAERQVLIRLRPRDLAAWNLTTDQVMEAVRRANQDVAVGLVSGRGAESMVRVEGRLRDPLAFADITVAQRQSSAGTPITVPLRQVADVIDAEAERDSISRINGEPSVTLSVFKNQGANVVTTGDAVKEAAAETRALLPADVELREVWTTSDWIRNSLNDVQRTIAEGAALTIAIVFVFLRSWRSTVITGLTLPISVLATFMAIHAFGFTLNFMTLMALSLCIGLLIDDAIVVRENIVRHLHLGKSHHDAARDGTEEIGLAVMATTFTICAVFVPVAFMKGIIGKFFYPFGMTVVVAVLVSLFVSFTLDPMLSSVWPDPPAAPRNPTARALHRVLDAIEHWLDRVHALYERVLRRALARRKTTLALAFALLAGSCGLVPLLGTEFIPETDDGWLSVSVTTEVGASLERTDAKVAQIEALLRGIPEVELVSSTLGMTDADSEGRNTARVNIRLRPRAERERGKKAVEAELRMALARIPGIDTAFGWDPPIKLTLLGPDPERLGALMDDLLARVKAVPGISDVQSSLREGTPTLAIRLRDGIAADLGVTNESLGRALRPLVAGEDIGTWLGPDMQNYRIVVRMPKNERTGLADLDALLVPTARRQADGSPLLVPLRQVAEVVTHPSPQVVKRQDLQRRVTITAGAEGRPSGDVGSDVKKLSESFSLPPGYRFDVGGATKDMEESFGAALGALVLAVVFIYLILASQFASFTQPVAIMASLPLALVGVFGALLVTRTTVNLFSIIGLIMLMGLVTKNAILLVDFANQARRDGKPLQEALVAAGQVRLRPILMTTFAMVFGMLPLALALGEGAELQAGMGRAIIGGVITSTLLTLVVVPVLYAMIEGAHERRRARRAARAADTPGSADGPDDAGGGVASPTSPVTSR